jgi:hypothetical protein
MAPEFKPGTFEPVITVSQRGDGLTRAFHGDNQGLHDVCRDSFRVAFSSSVGQGGNAQYERSSLAPFARVLAQLLWVRNLSNQLRYLNINNRFAKELNFNFPLPEPIVKLFNTYGHVEHEQVNYVQLDIERMFVQSLLDLVSMVKDADFDDETDPGIGDVAQPEWLRRLRLSSQGEIEIHTEQSISKYVSDIVSHISIQPISPEARLRYIKSIIDVATERDLRLALIYLRHQPDIGVLPRRGQDNITDDFRQYIWGIFGEHAPTAQGDVLDSKYINKSIRRTVEGMRQVIDEVFNSVALVPLPTYEQGSLAQMAETSDDLTMSHFPLSLADLTVTAAFKVGRVLRRFLRAAPEQTDESLRGDLIRRSVRRKA